MQKADYPRFRELLLWAAQVTVVPNGKDAGEISLALFDALAGYPLDAVKGAPAAILRMAHRDMDTATEAIQDADRRDMELADYLVGQYEEAIVLLGSMIPE